MDPVVRSHLLDLYNQEQLQKMPRGALAGIEPTGAAR